MSLFTFLAIPSLIFYIVTALAPIKLHRSDIAQLLSRGVVVNDSCICEVGLLSEIARSVLADTIDELVDDIQSIPSYQDSNIKEDYDYHTTVMRIRYRLKSFEMVTRQKVLILRKLLNSLTKILNHLNAGAIPARIIDGAINYLLDWKAESRAQLLTGTQIKESVNKMIIYKQELVHPHGRAANEKFIKLLDSGKLPSTIAEISNLVKKRREEGQSNAYIETELRNTIKLFGKHSPSCRVAFPALLERAYVCPISILESLQSFFVGYLANFNTNEFQIILRDSRENTRPNCHYYKLITHTTADHDTVIGLLKGRIPEIISHDMFRAINIQFAFIALLIRHFSNNEKFGQIDEVLIAQSNNGNITAKLEEADKLLFSIQNALKTGPFGHCQGLAHEYNMLLRRYSAIKVNIRNYAGLEKILCAIQGKITEISSELSKKYNNSEGGDYRDFPEILGEFFSWSFLKRLNSNIEIVSEIGDNDPRLEAIGLWTRRHMATYKEIMADISMFSLGLGDFGPRANVLVELEKLRDYVGSFDEARDVYFQKKWLKFIGDFYIMPEVLKVLRFTKETINEDINTIKQLIQWKGHDPGQWLVVRGFFDNISAELGYFKGFPRVKLDDFQIALYDLSQLILPLLTKEDKDASDWDGLEGLLQRTLAILIAWED